MEDGIWAEAEGSKRRYLFPYGDFNNVHRCALLVVEARAGQHKCTDVEQAALHLRAMLDTLMSRKPYMVRQHVRPV